jgi:phosphate transport system permease protein
MSSTSIAATNPVYRRRLIWHRFGMILSVIAMIIGLSFLAWILFTLLSKGLGALNWALLSQNTPAPGTDGGGVLNAIVGSFMMVGLATLLTTPFGILTGIYLAEYGDRTWLGRSTRFVTDIMLSAPSIVIGLFVWVFYVSQVGHFSGWAGSFALSLIALPVIVRSTDNMLQLVPGSLLEAAFALGAPRWRVAVLVRLRAVKAGVVTGVLLAVARISGETAPLLFTALNNQFFSTNMNSPMANLPSVINQFALSPYDNWRNLAWSGALLMTLAVLAINILARTVFKQAKTN